MCVCARACACLQHFEGSRVPFIARTFGAPFRVSMVWVSVLGHRFGFGFGAHGVGVSSLGFLRAWGLRYRIYL